MKKCDHPPRRSYEERKQLWRTNTCGEPASSRHHLVIVDINGGGHKNQNNVRGEVVVEKSGGVENSWVEYKCAGNKKRKSLYLPS